MSNHYHLRRTATSISIKDMEEKLKICPNGFHRNGDPECHCGEKRPHLLIDPDDFEDVRAVAENNAKAPQEKEERYKIKSGKYKGYTLHYTSGGQIFTRAGWYLMKSTKSGKVKDILYLEEALMK